MRNVDIRVFQIASTQTNLEEQERWLRDLGADEYVDGRLAQVIKDDGLTGSEMTIGHAAKRCYMAFQESLNPNVTKVRKDWDKYFANILKSGHGSVMEHGSYSYAIEGVSRVFTAEMNRHRAGVAISEGSLRYIRFNDIPWWMPKSIEVTDEDLQFLQQSLQAGMGHYQDKADLIQKKLKTQAIFGKAFKYAEECYVELCELWGIDDPSNKMPFSEKKILTSMFRRIIPMGVATGGVWTMNLRAIRHIIAIRTTEHAEEEIAHVFSLIAKDIIEREPRLMCDFVQDEATGCWVPEHNKV